MKRFLILLIALIVSIPLALGAVAGLSYTTTNDSIIPRPKLVVMGVEVAPCGYEWREPVFGGLIYKDFLVEATDPVGTVGKLEDAVFPLTVPEGYTATVSVTRDGQEVYSGSAAELANHPFLDNGRYQMLVRCEKNADSTQKGTGYLSYLFEFSVLVEPRLEHSYNWVSQGDVLALRLYNLQEGQVPTGECSLGPVTFMPTGEGQMTAYIPVSHDVESGTFPVEISLGRNSWQVDIRSVESSFLIQYEKTIADGATEEEIQAQAAARNQVDGQFKAVMEPLFDVADTTQYWEGVFKNPVEGNIVNEYGLFTYTNASSVPVRHTGIDIRCDRGTPVLAPNNGVVVYTGTLASTGHTVVVEHGGGLKSLFCHLNEILVEEGDVLQTGDELGKVGSSGQATFAHLHYEVRLGHATLNPNLILNGQSRLYEFL